jgi:hypothetical protein
LSPLAQPTARLKTPTDTRFSNRPFVPNRTTFSTGYKPISGNQRASAGRSSIDKGLGESGSSRGGPGPEFSPKADHDQDQQRGLDQHLERHVQVNHSGSLSTHGGCGLILF